MGIIVNTTKDTSLNVYYLKSVSCNGFGIDFGKQCRNARINLDKGRKRCPIVNEGFSVKESMIKGDFGVAVGMSLGLLCAYRLTCSLKAPMYKIYTNAAIKPSLLAATCSTSLTYSNEIPT